MHVLGAPPAFVLSQDQTLCKMVSERPFRNDPILQIAQPGKVSTLLVFASKKFQGFSYASSPLSEDLRFFTRCSFFKVLLPPRWAGPFGLPSWRELHSTTFFRNCQPLFSDFFHIFLTKFFPPVSTGGFAQISRRFFHTFHKRDVENIFLRPFCKFFLPKGLHFLGNCAMIVDADFIIYRFQRNMRP